VAASWVWCFVFYVGVSCLPMLCIGLRYAVFRPFVPPGVPSRGMLAGVMVLSILRIVTNLVRGPLHGMICRFNWDGIGRGCSPR